MVWDEAPTRGTGVGEAEDPFNSAMLHSFCTCSSRVQFLGLVEQRSASDGLGCWAWGGEGQGRVLVPGLWETQVREGALLPHFICLHTGGGLSLTSSFWAWREQEE